MYQLRVQIGVKKTWKAYSCVYFPFSTLSLYVCLSLSHICAYLYFSLLSSSSDASIAIHDLDNTTGIPQYTSKLVCNIGKGNKFRHKFSVETVLWYPHDTGMFISSGFDKLLKVWDTNLLLVS